MSTQTVMGLLECPSGRPEPSSSTHGRDSIRNRDRCLGTIADLYDRSLSNQPVTGMVARVNWHLGMIGHGASFSGGDRDEVLLLDHSGEAVGNELDYESPAITEPDLLQRFSDDLDAADGKIDAMLEGEIPG